MIQIKCKIGLHDLILVRDPSFALKNPIPRFDPIRDPKSHWITLEKWSEDICKGREEPHPSSRDLYTPLLPVLDLCVREDAHSSQGLAGSHLLCKGLLRVIAD